MAHRLPRRTKGEHRYILRRTERCIRKEGVALVEIHTPDLLPGTDRCLPEFREDCDGFDLRTARNGKHREL